ncbi:MAG TPA: hypothetical protein VGB27_01965 [Candidatus Binatia bacterium]
MTRYLTLMSALALILLFSGEIAASGRRGATGPGRVGGHFVGGAPRHNIQRNWRPSLPVRPQYPFHPGYNFYPYSYYRHDPRSVIIIRPFTYHPYFAPVTVVTSEPFYCHVHHVGFVSRVGFLDHVSGTHKIPLETANSICADGDESCVIEGY